MRTDSLGHYHRMQTHIPSTNGGISTQSNHAGGHQHPNQTSQMIYESNPFFQCLAPKMQMQHYPSAVDQASVISSSHPSSVNHPQPLLNMEPFSTHHISQISVASVMNNSNLPSRKGSFHTDDSLSASPQPTYFQPERERFTIAGFGLPGLTGGEKNGPGNAIGGGQGHHYEAALSVFSRHCTSFQRSSHYNIGTGRFTTASIACNEVGPFGPNRDVSNITSVGNQLMYGGGGGFGGFRNNQDAQKECDKEEAIPDDIELEDKVLDDIKLPPVQINIAHLKVLILQNLSDTEQVEEEKERKVEGEQIKGRTSQIIHCQQDDNQAVIDTQSVFTQPDKFHSLAPISPNTHQNSNGGQWIIEKDQVLTSSLNSNSLSTQQTTNHGSNNLIEPPHLIQNQLNTAPSLPTNTVVPHEQYQTLSIEQTIWSTQIPPQTQQEFFQNSIFQQQQHQQTNSQNQGQNAVIALDNQQLAGGQRINDMHQSQTYQQQQAQQPTSQSIFSQEFDLSNASSHMQPSQQQQQAVTQFNDQGKLLMNDIQQAPNELHPSFQQHQLAAVAATQHLINPQVVQPPPGLPIPTQQQQANPSHQMQAELQNQINQVAQAEKQLQQYLMSQQQQHVAAAISNQYQSQSNSFPVQQQQQIEQYLIQQQQILHNGPTGGGGGTEHMLGTGGCDESNNQHNCDQMLKWNHYDNTTEIPTFYMNRSINRYIMNPLLMNDTSHHKFQSQGSFRAATQSPELYLPGTNFSMIRQPSFEQLLPKIPPNMIAQFVQAQQMHHHNTWFGMATNPSPSSQMVGGNQGQLSKQQIAEFNSQQQQQKQKQFSATASVNAPPPPPAPQMSNTSTHQQQQHLQNQMAAAAQYQYQQQLAAQQHSYQYQQHFPPITPPPGLPNPVQGANSNATYIDANESPKNNGQVYSNGGYPNMHEMYSSFFYQNFRTKTFEIDEQLAKAAQFMDHRLLETLEFQEEEYIDDQNAMAEDDNQIYNQQQSQKQLLQDSAVVGNGNCGNTNGVHMLNQAQVIDIGNMKPIGGGTGNSPNVGGPLGGPIMSSNMAAMSVGNVPDQRTAAAAANQMIQDTTQLQALFLQHHQQTATTAQFTGQPTTTASSSQQQQPSLSQQMQVSVSISAQNTANQFQSFNTQASQQQQQQTSHLHVHLNEAATQNQFSYEQLVAGSSSSSTCSKDDDKLMMDAARRSLIQQQHHLQSRNTPAAAQVSDQDVGSSQANGGVSGPGGFSNHLASKQSTASFNKEEQKENKELLAQLRNQLNKFKSEQLISSIDGAGLSHSKGSINQVSAKYLSPFQLDPSKYLDKISNILSIINKVESSNHMKSEYERIKTQLDKKRAIIQTLDQEVKTTRIRLQDKEIECQRVMNDLLQQRDQFLKEREQYEVRLKLNKDQIYQLQELKDQMQIKINEAHKQLENEQKKNHDLHHGHGGGGGGHHSHARGAKEHERVKQIKQEYGKKLTDYQVEINDLREYIKKRSQEDQFKKLEEKRAFDREVQLIKDSYEQLRRQSEQALKERDTEVRILQESLQKCDPEFFNTVSQGTGFERIKQCPDCKKKDSKIADSEARVANLTEYIKKNPDRFGGDRQMLEEELKAVKAKNAELQQAIDETNLRREESKQPIDQHGSLDKIKHVVPFELVDGLISLFQKSNDSYSSESKALMKEILSFYGTLHPAQRNPSFTIRQTSDIEESKTDQQSSPQREIIDSISHYIHQLLVQDSRAALATQIKEVDETTKEHKERLLFEKMRMGQEICNSFKEVVNEGRNDRKVCHQIICDVERLMYKMSSLLIKEQMSLEEELKIVEPASINQVAQRSLATVERLLSHRQEYHATLNDLFQKTLETYLQIPHKLKPIYDRMKKYEHTVAKFYKADPSLLYELTADIIRQYQAKGEALEEKLIEADHGYGELRKHISKQQEENEAQKLKIINLNEKIVQINSAYNALQTHLKSTQKGQQIGFGSSLQTQQVHHSFTSQNSMPMEMNFRKLSLHGAAAENSSNGAISATNQNQPEQPQQNLSRTQNLVGNLALGVGILGSSTSSDGGSSMSNNIGSSR